VPRVPAIDLARPRDAGDILGGAFTLYWRNFGLFTGITYAVLTPIVVLGYTLNGHVPAALEFPLALTAWLVAVSLITAAHAHGVRTLGTRRDVFAGDALRAAARRLPAVAGTVALVWICIVLGCLLLVIPGIYVATRLYVSVQAVVAEGIGPVDGIRRSEELVDGNGWRVLGTAILIAVVATAFAVAAVVPFTIVDAAVDSDALNLVGTIVSDGVWLSFAALAATLLYFDLCARHACAAVPDTQYPAYRQMAAPERP
jgi:hypothetical protein